MSTSRTTTESGAPPAGTPPKQVGQAKVDAGGAPRLVAPLREFTLADVALVGGKNASLGEMIREFAPLGIRIPDGFALAAEAFRLHLREARLEEFVYGQLDRLDTSQTALLAQTAARIRERIAGAPLPETVRAPAIAAYRELSQAAGLPAGEWLDVAVRSSATAEDLPTASFAGQHETFLNVRGPEALDAAIRACMASLFTDRAIVYRVNNRFDHRAVALSVGVQRMVRSDLACAGTMFTLDTETGFRGVVMIDGSWGLGEMVVQGRVSPDEFWVHKATAKAGFRSVIRKELGEKGVKLIYAGAGLGAARSVREVAVPAAERGRFVLSDEEAVTLARWAMLVEEHYSRRAGADVPIDLEWAKDGRTGQLFILQARPETVHSQAMGRSLEVFRLKTKGKPILPGVTIHVLGPPTLKQSRSIATQRSSDPDEFWQLQARALTNRSGYQLRAPFGPGAVDRDGSKPHTRWLVPRLRSMRRGQLLEIVRTLDQQMNNTSVILLFQTRRQRLLFPGDAQIENWSYALNEAPDRAAVRRLLAGATLYKVGHHGSRNATPKTLWGLFRRRGPKGSRGRLQSVVSTKAGHHGSSAGHTEVPRRSLVAALERETDFHSTEKLKDGDLKETIQLPL